MASSRSGIFEIDRTLLWDVATGTVRRDLTYKAWAWCLAYAPDGRTLATGNADNIVHLWDVVTGKELRQFRTPTMPAQPGVYCVAFSPDGKMLISGGDDELLRLWDVNTGQQIRVFAKDNGSIRFAAFSPDGRSLVSGITTATGCSLWDVATGEQIRVVAGNQALTSLAFLSRLQDVDYRRSR